MAIAKWIHRLTGAAGVNYRNERHTQQLLDRLDQLQTSTHHAGEVRLRGASEEIIAAVAASQHQIGAANSGILTNAVAEIIAAVAANRRETADQLELIARSIHSITPAIHEASASALALQAERFAELADDIVSEIHSSQQQTKIFVRDLAGDGREEGVPAISRPRSEDAKVPSAEHLTFESIPDYWEFAHKTANISALTGHRLQAHLKSLGVTDLLRNDYVVLCIGVGTGDWIRELAERQHGTGSVTVVDISREALHGVSNCAMTATPEVFYGSQIQDRFDLAMSLWVTPHMSDRQVANQLAAVVPALKPDGVFAIHYNEPLSGTEYNEDNHISTFPTMAEALRSGTLRMTREKFCTMVDAVGGKVVAWPYRREVPEHKVVEQSAHIMRRDATDHQKPAIGRAGKTRQLEKVRST